MGEQSGSQCYWCEAKPSPMGHKLDGSREVVTTWTTIVRTLGRARRHSQGRTLLTVSYAGLSSSRCRIR